MLEVLVPELEPGEVLIELDTAGLGGWDADMREGWWPNGHPKLPLILGTDGSASESAIGSVSGIVVYRQQRDGKAGQRVVEPLTGSGCRRSGTARPARSSDDQNRHQRFGSFDSKMARRG